MIEVIVQYSISMRVFDEYFESRTGIKIQQDVYLCVIACTNAFDRVRHRDLLELRRKIDIIGKDIRILTNLANCIWTDNEYSR